MNIPINTVGKITKGQDQGWWIFIEPIKDEKTGQETIGFLLLIVNSPHLQEATEGYDYWMEDMEQLQQQMDYFGWKIEWLA